jgi:hypothetical protein
MIINLGRAEEGAALVLVTMKNLGQGAGKTRRERRRAERTLGRTTNCRGIWMALRALEGRERVFLSFSHSLKGVA